LHELLLLLLDFLALLVDLVLVYFLDD
jgi:hypothetical protein